MIFFSWTRWRARYCSMIQLFHLKMAYWSYFCCQARGRESMIAGFYHEGYEDPLLMLMRRRTVHAGLVVKVSVIYCGAFIGGLINFSFFE